MTKVLFAGGGTGGHLMPALAIAEAMVALDPSIEPFFVGSQRGIEARVLPRRPWPHELLPLEPIYRREWWRNIGLPLSLYRTLRGVRRILGEHDPGLVVGTGGYVSGPVVWAALNRRIPGVLQEQNAFPGIATRRLARRVRQIHLGFPEAAARLNPGRQTVVSDSGNPIQPPPSPRPDRGMSKRSLGFDPTRPVILVMGGSQGALAINRAVAEALGAESWPAGSQLLWQTGEANHTNYQHWYQPGLVRVEPFLDPIADAYAAADLVVCRAGAMSLAELAAWGLPSVLIPLPTAAANHQLANARAMAEAGAAVLLEQPFASGRRLSLLLAELLERPARLADIAAASLARARPDAAREIAAAALGLLSTS